MEHGVVFFTGFGSPGVKNHGGFTSTTKKQQKNKKKQPAFTASLWPHRQAPASECQTLQRYQALCKVGHSARAFNNQGHKDGQWLTRLVGSEWVDCIISFLMQPQQVLSEMIFIVNTCGGGVVDWFYLCKAILLMDCFTFRNDFHCF